MEKHEGGLITAIKNEADNTMDNRKTINTKQKWEEKQIYELINNISQEKIWMWLRKGNLERKTISPNRSTKQRN